MTDLCTDLKSGGSGDLIRYLSFDRVLSTVSGGGMVTNRVPETVEQRRVVRMLRASKIVFCSIPNGGYRSKSTAAAMVAEGMVAGAPDLLIFDPPPGALGAVGVALEMKALDGRLAENQKAFLDKLQARGWIPLVCYGAEEAITRLRSLGYLLRC